MTTTQQHYPAVDVEAPAPGDQELWSVTTILNVLDKPGIDYWVGAEAGYCAIRNERTWKAILAEDGELAAVKYIRDARFRPAKNRLSDRAFGTALHAIAEKYAITGTMPRPTREQFMEDYDAAVACINQLEGWFQRAQPEFIATEMTVYTPTYGVAGTSDGIFRLHGSTRIFDYKGSKKSYDDNGKPTRLYDEIGLQLAAYRYAEFTSVWHARRFEKFKRRYYLISEEERSLAVPVPEVDGGIGIKITPEHCTAYPIDCGPDMYEAFLYVLEAARWKYERARTVIGKPLPI